MAPVMSRPHLRCVTGPDTRRCALAPSALRSRRPAVVCHSRLSPDNLLVQALDKVLTQISRIIYDHESKKKRLKASGETIDVEVQTPGKKVQFSCKSSADKLVKEPVPGCSESGRGLDAYLSLPLTEYALLDPKWITQPDPEQHPDVFVLKVPLNALLHVELEPQVTIRVVIDSKQRKVHFYATKFMVGDARFDTNFNLTMDAILSHKPVPEVSLGANLAARWRSFNRELAVATGTAPLDSQSDSEQQLLLPPPAAAPAPSYNANPVMVPLPRSLSPRASADTVLVSPSLAQPRSQQPVQPVQGDSQPATSTAATDSTQSMSANTSTQPSNDSHTSHTPTAPHSQSDATASGIRATTGGIQDDKSAGSGSHSHMSAPDNGHSSVSQHGYMGSSSNGVPGSGMSAAQSDNNGTLGEAGSSNSSSSTAASDPAASPQPPPAAAAADAGMLHCAVDMRFDVVMPPPLSVVPGPLLALAGSLLARFAVQALLPGFLELLSVDYGRWVTGTRTRTAAAGSLLPPATTATQTSDPAQTDTSTTTAPHTQDSASHSSSSLSSSDVIDVTATAASEGNGSGHSSNGGSAHGSKAGENVDGGVRLSAAAVGVASVLSGKSADKVDS